MNIETKYKIGEKVWVVYKSNGEVNVYSDIIESYTISEDGVTVWLKDSSCVEFLEESLILYDDTEALLEKIKELDDNESKDVDN